MSRKVAQVHLLLLCEVHILQHSLKLVHDVLVAHLANIPPLNIGVDFTICHLCQITHSGKQNCHLLLYFVEIIEAVGPGQLARRVGLGMKLKWRNT